jgi:pimeloyl-ACP methyl ester carboxylesterase
MTDSIDTIVLIHSLWLTPRSWERWIARYASRGYTVHAPAWPGMEGGVEEINRDPSPIAELCLTEVADHYDRFIRALESPPIIMGHGIGGTLMQVLLDRGLGAAGVGVASGKVKGVPGLPLSAIRAPAPRLSVPLRRSKIVPISPKQFHSGFANTLTPEESNKLYARYAVPAASSILAEIALVRVQRQAPTKVDFASDVRAPLLFIAFGEDRVVPRKACRRNAARYTEVSRAITEFKEFPGRPHFPGAPGWEEVANYALSWAIAHAMPS